MNLTFFLGGMRIQQSFIFWPQILEAQMSNSLTEQVPWLGKGSDVIRLDEDVHVDSSSMMYVRMHT